MWQIQNIFQDEALTTQAPEGQIENIKQRWINTTGGLVLTDEELKDLGEGTLVDASTQWEIDNYANNGLGGVLFKPILDFVVSIGDAIINALQGTFIEPKELENSNIFNIARYLIRSNKVKSDNAEVSNDPSDNQPEDGSEETTDPNTASTYPDATTVLNVDTSEFHYGWLNLRKRFYYVKANYSPEEIFTSTSKNNKIPAFNVNFFSDEANTSSGSEENIGLINLRPMISSWYIALRNLSIVGLLCVLLYIGIQILLKSTAADKAKYKKLLGDWIIAFVLLFTMHYIMIFTVTIAEAIVTGINSNSSSAVRVEGEGIDIDYTTNLVGATRFQTQYKNIGRRMPFVIMYVALVAYTVMFTIFYLRRAIMMAFLTIIAPLVAFTYPLDKITDGKAQAFEAWLREYVYNALLQPFHLIIYTVFVTNAINFAKSNVFYMVASLWFVLKAEQILRGFFGFNKARGGTIEALHTIGLASILNKVTKGGTRIKGAANAPSKQIGKDTNIRFSQGADLAQLASGVGQSESTGSGLSMQIPYAQTEGVYDGGSQQTKKTANYRNLGAVPVFDATIPEGASSSTPRTPSPNTNSNSTKKNKQNGFQRLWRTKTARLPQKAHRAIKGIAKTGVKSAYTAGFGALAGAIALASGGDLGAALAATSAGMGIGDRVGNGVINRAGKTYERLRDDADIYFDDDDAANRKVDKMMYGDDNLYNYVRGSMIAQNNGIIPTNFEVENRLEQYRPFLKRGINIKEAERAMKVADDMSASDPRYNINYEEAALMVAAGKQDGITKSALQKDGDKLMRDTKATLMSEGHLSEPEAQAITDKYYSFQERIHGVVDHQTRKEKEPSGRNINKQQEDSGKGKSKENTGKKAESSRQESENEQVPILTRERTNNHEQNLQKSRERRAQMEEDRKNIKRVGMDTVDKSIDTYEERIQTGLKNKQKEKNGNNLKRGSIEQDEIKTNETNEIKETIEIRQRGQLEVENREEKHTRNVSERPEWTPVTGEQQSRGLKINEQQNIHTAEIKQREESQRNVTETENKEIQRQDEDTKKIQDEEKKAKTREEKHAKNLAGRTEWKPITGEQQNRGLKPDKKDTNKNKKK